MESGEIIYWNKYFEPSKEDLAEYRKKQFTAMREELLENTKTVVEDAEIRLKRGYTAHCIEVRQ
jgi:glutamate formiminotransferase